MNRFMANTKRPVEPISEVPTYVSETATEVLKYFNREVCYRFALIRDGSAKWTNQDYYNLMVKRGELQ